MGERNEKIPLVGISILTVVLLVPGSLTNAVGYQTAQSLNQKVLLLQSIVDIDNSIISNKLSKYKGYTTHYFLIWKIRGEIKDLEIGQDHIDHFNTTHVVSTGFALVYLIPFVPIPLFRIEVSRNEEWWLVWGENHLFNKEKITENHIDFFTIEWGELFHPDHRVIN